jgi:hypothetical protein
MMDEEPVLGAPFAARAGAPPLDLESPAVQGQFTADFAAHLATAPPVEGLIRPGNAWLVLSALQLALSHPRFPESIRGPVESFARQLQAIVSVTPTLAAVAEAGWHRDQDVPSRRRLAALGRPEQERGRQEGETGGDPSLRY